MTKLTKELKVMGLWDSIVSQTKYKECRDTEYEELNTHNAQKTYLKDYLLGDMLDAMNKIKSGYEVEYKVDIKIKKKTMKYTKVEKFLELNIEIADAEKNGYTQEELEKLYISLKGFIADKFFLHRLYIK